MEIRTSELGGLVLVDKPAGMTSHDAVAIVRRAVGIRRVGHAGTLDPFATGLLVMLTGRGTRLIPYIDGEPKVYEATISFGSETDTDDMTGVVTREASIPTDTALAEAIARLIGEIEQLPPAYSAKKVGGVRAYDAARRGAPLTLRPVPVTVRDIRVLDRQNGEIRARIECSGGTYVRALARDMGRLANSAAHLAALRRVRSGPFDVTNAYSIEAIRESKTASMPLRQAVASMPAQRLNAPEVSRVLHGNGIPASVEGEHVALLDEETLIAVAERAGDQLRPVLVLRDP
jgi:tRNA pseudouridine55 synthase